MAEAVVVPGGMFGPAAGLLMYAAAVAERRGATVHRHSWSHQHQHQQQPQQQRLHQPQRQPQPQPPAPFEPSIENWVRGELGPLFESIDGTPLLIAKSLGTNAATLAAERSLPAVWLTPILTVPWVAAALGRARAPFLLVGGTADAMWDGALARRLSPYVLEVEGADHGMYVPGPLTDSVEVLGRVVAAMEEFLDRIAWPG